jgi:membrane protease YdiL (CAAX protease family)
MLGHGRWSYIGLIAVVLTGLPLGLLERQILRSLPFFDTLTMSLSLPALILAVGTGFLEEWIFRGILLRTSQDFMGEVPALVYVAAIYTLLLLGYGSWPLLIMGLATALLWGWVVLRTGSIYAVGLAQGLSNIMIFLLRR